MDSLTIAGTVLGTAGYLSPEQARGERAGPASDRYALGIVAFELLTGRRPFESESATAEAAAHVHAEIPSVSAQLDPVFQRALAKEPGDRFQTSAEFVQALREALDPGSHTTRRLAPVRAAAVVRAPHRVASSRRAARRRRPRCDPHRDGDEGSAAQTQSTPAPTSSSLHPGTASTAASTATSATAATVHRGNGVALTDQATRLLQAGDWAGAERIAQQAVAALQGSGQTYEAYAEYDLGLALAQLGRCDEALRTSIARRSCRDIERRSTRREALQEGQGEEEEVGAPRTMTPCESSSPARPVSSGRTSSTTGSGSTRTTASSRSTF